MYESEFYARKPSDEYKYSSAAHHNIVAGRDYFSSSASFSKGIPVCIVCIRNT